MPPHDLTPPDARAYHRAVNTGARRIERDSAAFRRTTLALFAAGFSTFALLYCVQPLLPEFAREFQVSAATSSLAVSLTNGCLAVAMLVVGALSETWGRKPLIVTSLALAALLTAACAAAPSWGALLAVRAVEGVVFAGLPAIAMAYIGEEMDVTAIGLAMGIYVSGTALGGLAGRVLTAVLADVASWRFALTVVGGLGLLSALAVSVLLPASAHFHSRSLVPARLLGAYRAQLRDPVLARLFALGFLTMGAFIALYNYISFRLLEPPYGFSQAGAGAIFVLYLLGMISSPWSGSMARHLGQPRTLVLNLALMLGGAALTIVEPIAVVATGMGLFTFGFFAAHSVTSSWVGQRAPERKAQAAALYLFFYYLGGSIAGAVGGVFWDRWRWPGVAWFLIVLLAIALALARALTIHERDAAPPLNGAPASPAGA